MTDTAQLPKQGLIFDCTDSAATQALLVAARLGERLIRAGCDGWHVSAVRNPQGNYAIADDMEAGYMTPSWVGSAAMAAALAVEAPVRKFNMVTGEVGGRVDVL